MIKFKLGIYFSLRPVSPSTIRFLGDKTITKTVKRDCSNYRFNSFSEFNNRQVLLSLTKITEKATARRFGNTDKNKYTKQLFTN